MNTWLEVHLEDEVLTVDPGAWPEAAALVDQLAGLAEAEGARLSFRVRTKFAAGDRFGFLAGLVARGHEVGAHAHGRDLEEGVAALRAAGVTPTVMAPGLVQAGPHGEAALVARAVALGALGLTDRLEVRRWMYQGWLPRRHPGGPWMLDVSVSPFAWGVLRDTGATEPEAGHDLDWAALDRCARAQAAWVPPEGHTPFFGATLHETNLCPPRSLTPPSATLDGMRRWVAAWRPQVSAAAAVGPEVAAPPPAPPHPTPVPAPERLHHAREALAARARAALLEAMGARFGARGLPPHQVIRGDEATAAIVAVHAGEGGLVERLRFLGLPDDAFAPADLWIHARRPAGWPAPGNPAHIDDARRVLAAAAAEGRPIVLLSWSGGCVSAARALLELHAERPAAAARVVALVDVEGPPDRMALVKPGADAEWASFPLHDDAAWAGRELVKLFPNLARLPAPPAYHRWQATPDHVHGVCTLHADVAVAAARAAGLAATLTRVDGPLAAHGGTWRAAMAAIVGRGAREARPTPA